MHALRIGPDAIAAGSCIRFEDTVHFYQRGRDALWSRYGPGAAILAYSVQEAIREEADPCRGCEPCPTATFHRMVSIRDPRTRAIPTAPSIPARIPSVH